jgi:serine/threonine-protein kinase
MMNEQEIVLKDRYRILGELGRGGMATVYKVQDLALGRIVAIKVLHPQYAHDPDFLARFQAEARAAANLVHPNVVDVFDVGQDGDQHFIVMEYVQGRDLKSLIRTQAPLPIPRAVDLAIQVCAAVGYAHRSGLIHRDLKPQNVLVTPEDRVKVTDFGIARAVAEAAPTEPGTVWGTAQYLAPEQALGKPASPASDVYALGVVLYEMLAGRLPFEGDTRQAIAMQHIQADPPPLRRLNPQVPTQLEAIVSRAMVKEPAHRYPNADELGQALRAYRRRSEDLTTAIPTVEPGARPVPAAVARPRTGMDWPAVILGLLAVIALLGLIPLWLAVYDAYAPRPAATLVPQLQRWVEPAQAGWLRHEGAQPEGWQVTPSFCRPVRDVV